MLLRRTLATVPAFALASFVFGQSPDQPAVKPTEQLNPPTTAQMMAQETPAAAAPLTLDEAVARALQKNFDLKIQHFSTEIAQDSLVIAKSDYDPTISASASKAASQSPDQTSIVDGNGNIVSVSNRQSEAAQTRLNVSQRVVTGATATLSGAVDRSESSPSSSRLNPVYDSDVSLSVRQPLLKGGGLVVNRAAIERAKIGITIANTDFRGSVLTVVRNVEITYYNLAFARAQLGVRRFSLTVAEKLMEENKSRRSSGVATDLDVLQAEVSVANARRNLLQAEQTVRDTEDDLISLTSPMRFEDSIGELMLPTQPDASPSFSQSYKLAIDNTPEYKSSLLSIEQFKIDSDVAKRSRLPTLDLGGAVGYNSREGSYYNAASHVWDGDGYAWQIDATLSFPWGLREERARYRQSLASLNRAQTRLQQIEQTITVNLRTAIRAVETSRETLRISQLATELSQKQYDLEKARYDAGISIFRRVQESQEDYDTARINEFQSRLDLFNAYANLARLEGSSLQRYNIALE